MDNLYSETTTLNEIFANVKDCSEFTENPQGKKWQFILKILKITSPNYLK